MFASVHRINNVVVPLDITSRSKVMGRDWYRRKNGFEMLTPHPLTKEYFTRTTSYY